MPNRIEAGEAKAQPNSHREAKATAPVLDSTRRHRANQEVLFAPAADRGRITGQPEVIQGQKSSCEE